MPFRLNRVVLFSLFLLLGSGWTDAATIYLKEVALIDGPELILSELAIVVTPDTELKNRLTDLKLGAAPESLTLLPVRAVKDAVESRIKGELFIVGARISLIPLKIIPREEAWFYEELLDFLGEKGAERNRRERIVIEMITFPSLPPRGGETHGADEISAEPVFESVRGPLAGEVEIKYRIPGVVKAAGSFRIRVRSFLPVARTRINLEAKQKLVRRNLYYPEKEIIPSEGEILSESDYPEAYETTVRITKDSPIYLKYLRKELAVRAGDQVTVYFVKPGLKVRLSGRALGSGALGDSLRVRPDASGKRFTGHISGDREVTVEIP